LQRTPVIYAVVSASLFGLSAPLAKILVEDVPPVALAGLLYIGAFLGLSLYMVLRSVSKVDPGARPSYLVRGDLKFMAGAVLAGGIAGPILLMMGLSLVTGFATSLLLSLEAVATAAIAVLAFREPAGSRLWLALGCMTVGGVLLTWDTQAGGFDPLGPVLVVLAMICWGVDNNLTRAISSRDAVQITMVKGAVAGSTSLAIAWALGMVVPLDPILGFALLLGALSYGISLVLFIRALEGLGSARTGAFFSVAPFVGAVASILILGEWLGWLMLPASAVMAAGVWLLVRERHSHEHTHEEVTHVHSHGHDDIHHGHEHEPGCVEPHCHAHAHDPIAHAHPHWPDGHHRHRH
jgi:drug/metabolite transporter (DMT)-like permease